MSDRATTLTFRAFLLLAVSTCAASLTASCLTPDFRFAEDEGDQSTSGTSPLYSDHCENRMRDMDETDIDCGGLDCNPCEKGKACSISSDCVIGECTKGICEAASCTDQVRNGTETDEDCGGELCSPCVDGDTCGENSDCQSGVCAGGRCAEASCIDGVKNGGESDVDCGGPDCNLCDSGEACVRGADCAQPPVGDIAVALCEDGICALSCPAGLGDCNGQVVDGCETSVNTNANHCGQCGQACELPNTSAAKCASGECLIDKEATAEGCSGDWLDCNGVAEDGCEVDSASDLNNCGGCGSAFQCSDNNGAPTCANKTCSIVCAEDFSDCDGDALSNGCETDIGSNVSFCGGCDPVANKCDDGGASETPNCVGGSCGLTSCPAGFGDCDGDGTCTDALDSLTNCGVCGKSCFATNATTACVDQGGGAFDCEIAACVDGGGGDFENCDGLYETGCKTDVKVTTEHCGACRNDCGEYARDSDLEISSISCVAADCKVDGCKTTFLDCDSYPQNGCEVNSANDKVRCGGCLATDMNAGAGVTCEEKANSTASCSGSACNWVCMAGYGDVDGDLLEESSNGCETVIPPCEAAYVNKAFYNTGDLVSYVGKNWECAKSDCRQPTCLPGVSCDWGQPWTDVGLCE